jgi:hypothetical protein
MCAMSEPVRSATAKARTARARRAGPPQGQSPARGAPDAVPRSGAALISNMVQLGSAARYPHARYPHARLVIMSRSAISQDNRCWTRYGLMRNPSLPTLAPSWLPKTDTGEEEHGRQVIRCPVTCRFVVGVAGFEPAASSSRTKRAAKLRYTPAARNPMVAARDFASLAETRTRSRTALAMPEARAGASRERAAPG